MTLQFRGILSAMEIFRQRSFQRLRAISRESIVEK